MRTLLSSFFVAAALLLVSGCSDSAQESDVVATTADEFAAYDALMAEDEASSAEEREADDY